MQWPIDVGLAGRPPIEGRASDNVSYATRYTSSHVTRRQRIGAAMLEMFAAIGGRGADIVRASCGRHAGVMREGGAILETACSRARHFRFPRAQRHAAGGGPLPVRPQAASAGRRNCHREARRVAGLAARWKMGGNFTLATPYARHPKSRRGFWG
jgi:hypothetical protein